MQRSHILKGLILAAFAGAFASQVASCTLETEGKQTPVVKGAPCTVDANCDDKNPCTTEVCPTATLVCEYTLQDTGDAPTAAQLPSDCQKIVCTAGEPSTVDEAQDFINDNNSCTTDACVAGKPTNEVLMDGAACDQGVKKGQCEAGTCTITCVNNNDCNDGNTCSDDLCNTSTSKCVYTNLDGVPTPGSTPIVGDCKLHICNNGLDVEINDDADVTDDNNPCTFDVCNNGLPENNNVPDATACTPGDVNVCDGNGACVECTAPSHCVGIIETECEKRNCVANKCEIAYEGQTTLASPVLQDAKDCKKVVCNGAAGVATVNDDGDLPDDSKPCTTDTCSNGTPVFTNNAQGSNCGNNQVCNATGGCVGCNAPSDCAGTDTFCQARTCTNNVCGLSFTANGTDLPTGQTTGDCKVIECNGMGGTKTSVLQSDIPVDGNACTQDVCNAQGTPSNPATAINSPCSVGMNNACDGNGTCKKSQGTACGAGNECVTTRCVDGVCCNSNCTTLCEACNVAGSIGTCTAVPKGQDDTGCSGMTQSCNASNDCDDENGQACAANSACLSNFCADGVCCNSACDTACKSCNVTGSVGTCGNLPAGSTDNAPTNLCVGSSQCDGMGICKKVLGTMCGAANECLSGNCIDGVCCNTTCATDCQACNLSASMGTCTNVAMGNDDGGCSGATESCDGIGGCKGELGATCAMGGECFSANCIENVCCNTTCNGLCESCLVAKTEVMQGTCSPIKTGTDPDNECMPDMPSTCNLNGFCDGAGACQKYTAGTECAPQSCSGSTQTNADECSGTGTCVDNMTTNCAPYTCNGTSGCRTTCTGDGDCTTGNFCAAPACVGKKADGQNCGGNNQCTSNFCVDGVCCADACTGTCRSCNVAGSLGTCANTPQYTNDGCPMNETCNGGVGVTNDCDLVNGQTCGSNGQCASNNCASMVCAP